MTIYVYQSYLMVNKECWQGLFYFVDLLSLLSHILDIFYK